MNHLKEIIESFGASKAGFADLSITPDKKRDGLKYGISILKTLNPEIIRRISNGPTPEYDKEYHTVNAKLNDIGEKTEAYIKGLGYSAVAKTTTVVTVREDNRTDYLPHKTVATLSGMGWIGKNALLVTPGFGSAVRLTSIYTDMPLETGEPVIDSLCGDCMRCVNACPAGAITGNNWKRENGREYIYDAAKCREETKRQCAAIGIDNTICGICINVCPYTQKYIKG